MRFIRIWILYLFGITLSFDGFCQRAVELRKEIDKILRHETDPSLKNVHDFIIGIIDGDSTYVLPYGVRDPGFKDVLTAADVFEIGSVTKVMTADMILRLYAEKLLDIDDPLNKFIPQEYSNPAYGATLREILMHHSGFPKLPETLGETQEDFNSPYSGFTREDLLRWYRDMIPGARGDFRYSHAGYALLEIVIEEVTGTSYVKAFDRSISERYGLQQTHALYLESMTPGHDLAGKRATPWSFQSFRASEGAQSNLSNLIDYVRALLYDTEIPLMWDSSLSASDKKLRIAPGWYQYLPKKNFPVYVHTGRTSGHSAMICFSKKTKTGVIILANSSAGTDDLGLLILRMIKQAVEKKMIFLFRDYDSFKRSWFLN